MAEVTFGTFIEAARKAAANLDGGEKEEQSELYKLIQKVIKKEKDKPKSPTRISAEAIADRIMVMTWPEKEIEIRRATAASEITREAERRYIIKEVQRLLEGENAGGS